MRDMMRDVGQVGNRNRLVGIVAAAITFAVVLVWGGPGIDPSLWDEVAVVAGVRPPYGILPGFWRVSVGWLFSLFGARAAQSFLPFLGAAVAAFCSYLVCLITRQILAYLIRTGRIYPVWYRRIAPFFSFVAAVLFGVSDPLCRVAQTFSPDELRLAIFLSIVHISLRWFVVGGRWRLFPLMALMGLLAAETPFGYVLPIVFAVAYTAAWMCFLDNIILKPAGFTLPADLPKWRMLFLFLGGLALGIWLNAETFIAFGGAKACAMTETDVYFRYFVGYWAMTQQAASIVGWVLGFGFCLLPFIVSARLLPRVLRDDRAMPFRTGAILLFVGVLALSQSGVAASTRFWTFAVGQEPVASGFLLTFFVFCAVETIAFFGSAFAFECQRTYLTAGGKRDPYPDRDPEEEDLLGISAKVEAPGVPLRCLVPAAAVLVLIAVFCSASRPVEYEMQRIVDDAIQEILDECGDAEWLFTDGRLDAGIEFAAKIRGKRLRTLNMMSGPNEWEVYVRSRGFDPDGEDFKMVQAGVPALLRMWAGEKTNGMEGVALQLGFDYWKRERKTLPVCSGLIAKERGMTAEEAGQGVERSRKIAERILATAPRAEDEASPSTALANAFSAVNWRLSRFAHLRDDRELANGLDQVNGVLRRMLDVVEQERQRTFMQLTPHEGLEIALRRANFAEARRYATVVIQNDEEDPQANFALGMSAIMAKRYKEAEVYLKNVLKRRPKEPAALNNLSIVCRKQFKFKEAVSYARAAQELLPDSPEVKRSLEDALKKAP